MAHLEVVDSVYEKRPLEHNVDDLGHLAGVAVFNGEHGAVALAVYDGVVGGAEIRVGNLFRVRENALGGDVGESAFDAAVSDGEPALEHLLVFSRDAHIALKKVHVVGADFFVRNEGGVLDYNLVFPPLVENREPVLNFVLGDLRHLRHALLKELRHFFVDGVYVLSCFFKAVHLKYSSANFLNAGSERRICSAETQ